MSSHQEKEKLPPPSMDRISELAARRAYRKVLFSHDVRHAKTRFKPDNLKSEMADKAAGLIEEKLDKGADLAARNKGRIALAGGALIGGIGLFLGRKPLYRYFCGNKDEEAEI